MYGVRTMSVLQAVGGQVSKGLMAAASSKGERGRKGQTHSGVDLVDVVTGDVSLEEDKLDSFPQQVMLSSQDPERYPQTSCI